MNLPEFLNFKISRKYSFSVLTMLFIIADLFIVEYLKFPEKVAMVALVVSEIPMLVVAIAYVTGEAKIEISANYGKGPNTIINNSESSRISSPPPPREGGL